MWYRKSCKWLDWILGISWLWFMGFLYWGIGILHWSEPLFWWGMIGSLIGWGLWRIERILFRIEGKISNITSTKRNTTQKSLDDQTSK